MALSSISNVKEIVETASKAHAVWEAAVDIWNGPDKSIPAIFDRQYLCAGPVQLHRFPQGTIRAYRFGIYDKLAMMFYREISQRASWYESIKECFQPSDLGICFDITLPPNSEETTSFVSFRATGPAGAGKSYAVVQLVFRLRLRRDIFRVLYINCPACYEKAFLKDIVFMMGDDIHDRQVKKIFRRSKGRKQKNFYILMEYFNFCEKKNLKIIYIYMRPRE